MRVLESAIGWLAPPVCISCGQEGEALCSICSLVEILPFGSKCWHCGARTIGAKSCAAARRNGSPSSVWVVTDYENVAKDMIKAYKFGQQRAFAIPIANAMAQTLVEFNSVKALKHKNYLLMPLPTATARVRQRGFDHTKLLTREIKYKLKMSSANNLHRFGQTRQVGAKRSERFKQLESSFYVKNPEKIKNRNILLIDDVITTGATLCAASKALKAAGVKQVDAVVFAKKL